MKRLSTDDMRDAVAFMRATHAGDIEGRMAIAQNCDPARLVDGLASFALGLASLTVEGGPAEWLDMLTVNVDGIARMVDERKGDHPDAP